jgi:hypothetical protein
MRLNDSYDAKTKTTTPGALSALVKAGSGASIARPGGTPVRLSIGAAEHVLHRYVIDGPDGVKAYDATTEEGTTEDLEADDWTLSKPTKPAAKGAAAK